MSDYNDIAPTRSLFWLVVKWLLFIALAMAVLRLFILPLFVADRVANREFQKFDAETSAQVYDHSRQYRQGVNRDIARYCREMAEAPEGSRKAVADLIRSTLDTYEGELTQANQSCVAELGE